MTAGRGARPDRVQRGRQDDAGQPDQRAHPRRLRPHRLPGRRHHRARRSTRRSSWASREASSSSTCSTSSAPSTTWPSRSSPARARRASSFAAGRPRPPVRRRGDGGAHRVRARRQGRDRRRAGSPRASGSSSTWRSPTRSARSSSSWTSPPAGSARARRRPIMDIITAIVRSGGITAVIIEHDMDVVFTYCPRIVVMHQGTILADGTPDEIRRNDQVTANLLGTHDTREDGDGGGRRPARGRAHQHRPGARPRPARRVADRRGRRVGLPRRAQRRRQDHDHRERHGAPARPERPASRSAARTSRGCPRTGGRSAASATRPRTPGSSPT